MTKLLILLVGSVSGAWASAQNITFTETFTVERSAQLALLGTRASFLKAAHEAKAAAFALCQGAHYTCAAPFVFAKECKSGVLTAECAVIARAIGTRQMPLATLVRLSSHRCMDLTPFATDLRAQFDQAEDSVRTLIAQVYANQQNNCELQHQRDLDQSHEAADRTEISH